MLGCILLWIFLIPLASCRPLPATSREEPVDIFAYAVKPTPFFIWIDKVMRSKQDVKPKDITPQRLSSDFACETSTENDVRSLVLLMVTKMNWNILTDIISKIFFEERPCTISEIWLLAIHT